MAILVNGEEVGITGPELPAASTFPVDRGTFEVRSFFGGTQAEVRVTDLSQTQPAGRYRLRTASDVISIDRAASAAGNPWDTFTTVWSAASSGAQTITVTDAVDSTVLTALTLNRNTTHLTPAAGLGVRLSLGVETSTTINTQAAAIDALWTTVTHATRTADLVVSVVVSGTLTEGGRIDGSGSAWVIGNGDGGVVAATGWTVRAPDAATGGVGNVAGADLTISPGLGTGTGDEGTVIFSLPIQAAAGDNIQTRATRMTMDMAGSSTQLTIEAAQAALYRTVDRGATNAAGFALALTAGNGGTAATTGNNGGAVTFTTGNATAGAAGANAGGNGGAFTFTGGTGADGGVASGAGVVAGGGGVGSAFNWTLGIGGIGGAASGADAAGAGGGGGTLTLTAGAGGAGGAGSAGAASGSGGAGGSLVLIPGAGGAAGANGGGGAGSAGAQGTVRINDNFDLAWGTDNDIRARNISAGIAANTAIAGFSVGTPVSQAAAANSFGLSNITASGDIQGLVNNGGNSLEWLLVDASARTITLGWGGFGTTVYANNGGTPEEVLRLTAIASPLSGAPATLFAATQFVSNSVVAGFVMSRLVNSLNNSLLLLGSQTVTSNATGAQYQSTISGRDITDTSGADNGTFFFNIARNHITASDQVTKTSVFMGNTEFDEITYHQASDLAVTFNMHKTVLIRMAGASTGVTLADQHLLDFTLSPIISTGAFTMVKAINIPTASGLSATWYGIFYDNAPNGGSIATASGVSLVLNPGGVVNITPYTLTPTAFTFTGANSTNNSTFKVENSSNAAAASHSIIEVAVGGVTSTGDPQVRWTIPSGTSWYAGPDNNGSDVFIIGVGTVVGTTPAFSLWPSGNANGTSHIYTSQGPSMADGAASATVLHLFTAVTQNEAGVTTRTGLHTSLRQDLLTFAGNTATLIINKAAGISAAGVAQGANISLVHGSGFRALTGGAAVNVSGMYFETQTAGTTGNYQALFAVSTGAAPALADHVGITAQDFAADDTRLYIQSQAGSAIIIGNNAVRTGLAGTATGSFVMSGAVSGVVTLTVAAAAGTWTMTLPAAVGGAGQQLADLAGNGITGWTDAASRREYKREIVGFVDYHGALQRMLQSPLYTFRYRPGTGHGTGDYETRYLGVMAGESDWAMHFQGGIVNPVNTVGYMVAGFRAVNEVQETHEAKIIRLEARVAELEARLAA